MYSSLNYLIQVICGGFGVEELEVLGETIERTLQTSETIRNIPIVVLGNVDKGATLEEILSSMSERDR